MAELTPGERFGGSLWIVRAKATARGLRVAAFSSLRPGVEYVGEQRGRAERFKVDGLEPHSAAALTAVVKTQAAGAVADVKVTLVQQRTAVSIEDNTVAALSVILANEEQFLATTLGEKSTDGANQNIFNPCASEEQWDGTVENKTYAKKQEDPFVLAAQDPSSPHYNPNAAAGGAGGGGAAGDIGSISTSNPGSGIGANGGGSGGGGFGGVGGAANSSLSNDGSTRYAEPSGPPPPKVDDGYNDVPDEYFPGGGDPTAPKPIHDANGNVVGMTTGGPRKWNQFGLKNLDYNLIAIGFPNSGISTILNNIVGSTKFPVSTNGVRSRWTPGPVSVMTATHREIHKFVIRPEYIEEDVAEIAERLKIWYRAKVIVIANMDHHLKIGAEPYKRLLKIVKRNFGDNALTKQIGILFNKVKPGNNTMSTFRDVIFDGEQSPFFAVDINSEFSKSSTSSLRVRLAGLPGFLEGLQELQLIDPNSRNNMMAFDPMVEHVSNVSQLQGKQTAEQAAAAAAEEEKRRVKPNEVLLKYYWPVDRCIKYTGPSPVSGASSSSSSDGADFWFGNMSVIEWPEPTDYELRDTRSGSGSGVDKYEKIFNDQVEATKMKAGVELFDALKALALKGKKETEIRELYQSHATTNQIVTRLILEVNPNRIKLKPEIRQLFYNILSQDSGQTSSNNLWGEVMETRRVEFSKLLGCVGEYFPVKMVIGGRFQFFKKAKAEKKEDDTVAKQGGMTELDLKGDEKKKKDKTVLLVEKGKEDLEAEDNLTKDVENDESWEIQGGNIHFNQILPWERDIAFDRNSWSIIQIEKVVSIYELFDDELKAMLPKSWRHSR